MPTAFDIGMHNGDDTAYYLEKGYDVVAIEANPALISAAANRFSSEIASGRLELINVAISDRAGEIDFYLHNVQSEWGTIVPPSDMENWTVETVRTSPLNALVAQGASLDFVKIDIEGADLMALRSLSSVGLKPTYVSCEAHSVNILCKLVLMGYNQFRLVNGKTARKKYRKHRITTIAGERLRYSFTPNSSGPFGDDLPSEWYSVDQIFHLWTARSLMYGHGWFDVHATSVDLA
ncbi:MAG: FkbM family methyltransferase [Alphaproteobacteria bacterium]|nr:MAG: FkbM family methyltransferase [Alphaproteobacteria bacterium]